MAKIKESKSNDSSFSRIELNNFLRSIKPTTEFVLPTFSAIALKRRPVMLNMLEPDPSLFKNLDDIEPWDEKILVPNPNKLTKMDIERIKKGMVTGKLYNISGSSLKMVFPQLTTLKGDILNKNIGWVKGDVTRCPLCPRTVNMRHRFRIYTHLEALHSSSFLICLFCKTALHTEASAEYHKLKCTNITNGSTSPNSTNGSNNGVKALTPSDDKISISEKYISTQINHKRKSENVETERKVRIKVMDKPMDTDNSYIEIRKFVKTMCLISPRRTQALERSGLLRVLANATNKEMAIAFPRTLFDMREAARKSLKIDKNFFSDLESVEPWDQNKPVPSLNELTLQDIAAIKKGMTLGYLYAFDRQYATFVFPAFPVNNLHPYCPLCAKKYRAKCSVAVHIESIHTKYCVECTSCSTKLLNTSAIDKHYCFKLHNF